MIELLIFAAGAATGAVAMLLPYQTAKRDRSLALTDLSTERQVSKALENRVQPQRGDNLALQSEVANLTNTNVELQREIGRSIAERRADMMAAPAQPEKGAIAFTPKRDANGRFAAKPKA